ncbi:MAG: hypothetical protein ACYTBJ_22025 [Planctomycetota bacterium]
MQNCSVTRDLQIVRGSIEDYKQLAHFHYRDSRPGGFTAVFAIRPSRNIRGSFGTDAHSGRGDEKCGNGRCVLRS